MQQHPSQSSKHPGGHARKLSLEDSSDEGPWEGSLNDARAHPDAGLLEGLLRGGLSAAERRVVVRHLLTGCPRCVEVTGHYWSLGE